MFRAHSQSHVRVLISGLLLALIALMGTASATTKDHHHDAKGQITDLEQQWRTATLTGDASMMDKLLSDDFVGISWTGQVNNKMSQLDRLRAKNITITKMDISDLKVKVVGPVAIVTSSAEIEGIADGNPMNGVFRYTRVYQRQPNGIWKVTNFEATRVPDGRMRGHHMPPPSPPAMTPPTSTPLGIPHKNFKAG